MERGMIGERNKKGVSVMVSYVLLLSIVVTLSIIVGGWIYFQAKNPPVGGESCEGVTVSADNFCCYAVPVSGGGGGGGGGGVGSSCSTNGDCDSGLVCVGGFCQGQGGGQSCTCTPGEEKCENGALMTCNGNLEEPCWDSVPCASGFCNANGLSCGISTSGPSSPAEKKENVRELFLQAKQKMIKFTIWNTGRFTVQNVLVRVETLPEVGEVFRYALARNTMPITPNNYTNYTTAVTGMGDGKIRWVQLVPVTSTLCSSQAVNFKLPEDCSKSVDQLPATYP